MDRVNAWLERSRNAPLPYTPKNRFKASDLGNLCDRRAYYSFFHVKADKPIDAKGIRIFDTGDAYEEMVMSWLKAIGEHIPYLNPDGSIPIHPATNKEDVQFPAEYMPWGIRSGRIDNVWVDEETKLWLYEIKSKKSEKWEKLKSPDPEHKIQTATYIVSMEHKLQNGDFKHIKELENIQEVHGVKFFYVNKDTSEVKEFAIPAEKFYDLIVDLDARMNNLLDQTKAKELPDKTESGLCYWCPFWAKCKKEFNSVQSYEEIKAEEEKEKK